MTTFELDIASIRDRALLDNPWDETRKERGEARTQVPWGAELCHGSNPSRKRQVRITIRSVLEEGVRELFAVPLSEWVQWASESVTSFDALAANDPLKSDSFRIDADLVRELGVLAAQISLHSKVPITKAHLIEEAGQRIIAQVEAEQQEVDESIQSTRPLR